MSDWALDPATGDLALPSGRVTLVTGDDAIAQDWALRVGTIVGEWYRDRSLGVDLDLMLGKLDKARELAIRSEIRRETLGTRGIVAVRGISLSLDRQSRGLAVDVDAKKDSGAVVPLSSVVTLPGGGA